MLIRLLAAFILVPLIELFLLLQLADLTSGWTTFGIVIITGVIGSILARREGVIAWYRFRSALAEGRMPGREIQDGLMIVFAAALLLTPGLLTDALGFALLTPLGRDRIGRRLIRRYAGRVNVRFQTFGQGRSGFATFDSESDEMETDRFHRRPRGGGYTIDAEPIEESHS